MSYPTVSIQVAEAVVAEILGAIRAGEDPLEVAPEAERKVEFEEGADYDRAAIERFSSSQRQTLLDSTPDRELASLSEARRTALEAEMAAPTFEALGTQEVACLQDPDFWRYLAIFPLRWYAIAREPELKPQAYGGMVPVLNADGIPTSRFRKTGMKTQVILRTFLWGKSASGGTGSSGDTAGSERAQALSGAREGISAIDVWHSHIVRPQIGHLGELPHALIDVLAETDPPPTTDDARELAKLLSRIKHTIAFDVYGYEAAKELVQEQLDFAQERLATGD